MIFFLCKDKMFKFYYLGFSVMYFQDPATRAAEQIIMLHDFIFWFQWILISIVTICYLELVIVNKEVYFFKNSNFIFEQVFTGRTFNIVNCYIISFIRNNIFVNYDNFCFFINKIDVNFDININIYFKFYYNNFFLIIKDFERYIKSFHIIDELEFRKSVVFIDSRYDYTMYVGKVNHNTLLEFFWTVFPCFILMGIAVPSISLLYYLDNIEEPKITVKITGMQWYWIYEFCNFNVSEEEFDKILNKKNYIGINNSKFLINSYMKATNELEIGLDHRLLSVDNSICIPVDTTIRILVTSGDVLHSWTVPSFGVKIDAVPGRLNQVVVHALRQGTFYGQCSELCGVNHGFMPIVVNVVSQNEFEYWYLSNLVQYIKSSMLINRSKNFFCDFSRNLIG